VIDQLAGHRRTSVDVRARPHTHTHTQTHTPVLCTSLVFAVHSCTSVAKDNMGGMARTCFRSKVIQITQPTKARRLSDRAAGRDVPEDREHARARELTCSTTVPVGDSVPVSSSKVKMVMPFPALAVPTHPSWPFLSNPVYDPTYTVRRAISTLSSVGQACGLTSSRPRGKGLCASVCRGGRVVSQTQGQGFQPGTSNSGSGL
jgi:hypothetical protein